jgi:hypothetical protein
MGFFLINLWLWIKEWHRNLNIRSGISEGLCVMFRKNRLGFQIFGPSRSCRGSAALSQRAQRLTLHGLTLWCFHGSCRFDELLQVVSIIAWQDMSHKILYDYKTSKISLFPRYLYVHCNAIDSYKSKCG